MFCCDIKSSKRAAERGSRIGEVRAKASEQTMSHWITRELEIAHQDETGG